MSLSTEELTAKGRLAGPRYQLAANSKAVFLDRDGVLNEEMGDYVWTPERFRIRPDVPTSLARLKAAGYYLVVVTNQAGIARGLYTRADVLACHELLQQASSRALDALYLADSHPSVSESILRKPDSGMLEKAIARFRLDPAQCWLVGDRARDLAAAARVGVRGILVGHAEPVVAGAPWAESLVGAVDIILGYN